MSKHEISPPPDFNKAVRAARGHNPLTLMEELQVQFEARLRANGGKLVPLDENSAPPPPDIVNAIRLQAIRNLQAKKGKA